MEEAESFYQRDKALIQMPGSSETYYGRFFRNSAIRTQSDHVMLLSSSHSLVVSITILQFMPDCFYSVQGALSSNHNLLILMADVHHHATCNSLP